MMQFDSAEKESLVAQFRACLDHCEQPEADIDGVDLHDLLAEVSMLKNEIRLESRQFKSMLEEMRGLGDSLREQNERLVHELERAREQAASAARQAERGLLTDMLDLYDRLKAGVDASALRKPGLLSRLVPAETRLSASLAEGLALTLQRVDDVLAGYRVRPIDVLGKALDPHLMRAVGIDTVVGQPDGVVLRAPNEVNEVMQRRLLDVQGRRKDQLATAADRDLHGPLAELAISDKVLVHMLADVGARRAPSPTPWRSFGSRETSVAKSASVSDTGGIFRFIPIDTTCSSISLRTLAPTSLPGTGVSR